MAKKQWSTTYDEETLKSFQKNMRRVWHEGKHNS